MTSPEAGRPRRPIPDETIRRQRLAADPLASAWVSANAGTGKTHVLSRRVLRLLLSGSDDAGRLTGTPPERILCVTFTKAAASEMASRVLGELAAWTIADEATLARQLTDLLGRAATVDEATLARRLFARALETPGGLKVQTIHAFAERLLQRFPLEAGVAPDFSVLDDATAAELMRAAVDTVLAQATGEANSPLGRALEQIIVHAVEERFEEIIARARGLAEKNGADLSRLKQDDAAIDLLADGLRTLLRVRPEIDADGLVREMAQTFAADVLPALIGALLEGQRTDVDQAMRLQSAARAVGHSNRARALETVFLTADREPRARLLTKKVAEARPDLHAALARAQSRFVELRQQLDGLTVVEISVALARLAAEVEHVYRNEKALRGALDYGDLINKAASLLSSSDDAQWVLFKLDGGLDHILVDEAQDTSPAQWRIVECLAEEFHAGAGARESLRTIFAVGDEKQSIYRFQGAMPHLFAEMGEKFAQRARAADQELRAIPLTLSFRTVAPVLEAVDRVFGGEQRPPGVTRDPTTPVAHDVMRQGEAGLVELWDPETAEEQEPSDPWASDDGVAAIAPAVRLAQRIAKTIRRWIDDKAILESEGRPIVESDILILVRKRAPFAAPMIRALKSEGIAVAGADRIRIADELVVRDLMALIDVLLMSEDDLALATVLKSPIGGLDEDALFALAASRKGSLWQALVDAAAQGRHAQIAAELRTWRAQADYRPPFEFLAALLDHPRAGGSVRARLLARLGPEAVDPLDEVLNLALTYDQDEAPSLQGFLAWLRSGGAEIKRDMEQGRREVRVMTVHGAKGLEAPIVFLADTCSARFNGGGNGGTRLFAIASPEGGEPAIVWPVKGTAKLAPIADAARAESDADRHEYHRLLYVAMTRARDRLYVTGFTGKKGRDRGCWYDLIEQGLAGARLVTEANPEGRTIRRLEARSAATVASRAPAGTPPMDVPLPSWATTPAPAASQRVIPIRPSRLAPLSLEEDEGEALAAPIPTPAAPPRRRPASAGLGGADRFQRGVLAHALLEHLPAIEPDRRARVAEAFLARRAKDSAPGTRRALTREVLAVLDDPRFAAAFGPMSRAEVPIAAEIAPPGGQGAPLRITGQIDRLADLGREVLLVDYKTNRDPPDTVDGVPEAYLLQLAAYRLALARIWPAKAVRCALLWTDGPRLMDIPATLLDRHEIALWDRP